jgi:pyrroloquinoline-quinone synthase
MKPLIERIDFQIGKRSLLKHPFYQMWNDGELSIDHLRGYSTEYFHLVKAIPEFVRNIHHLTNDPTLQSLLVRSYKEEADHREPWIRFAKSLGVSRQELLNHHPSRKTAEAIISLNDQTECSVHEGAAAMYAYEYELPKISSSKINGLKKFYGKDSSDAVEYFMIHEEVDIRHAALWRGILEDVPTNETSSAYRAATKSLDAQNQLLDSVLERYVGAINC